MKGFLKHFPQSQTEIALLGDNENKYRRMLIPYCEDKRAIWTQNDIMVSYRFKKIALDC